MMMSKERIEVNAILDAFKLISKIGGMTQDDIELVHLGEPIPEEFQPEGSNTHETFSGLVSRCMTYKGETSDLRDHNEPKGFVWAIVNGFTIIRLYKELPTKYQLSLLMSEACADHLLKHHSCMSDHSHLYLEKKEIN
jgi:hypothetical protein